MTNPGPDDVPRSPTGRIPQWVLDEAVGQPTAPTAWRAAPSTYTGDATPSGPRRRRGRNAISTLVVAALVVAVIAWTSTGHDLLPAKPVPTAAARPTATATATTVRHVPPPGLGEAPAALGSPAPLSGPASDSYRFRAHQPESAVPVAFSPCRPIHYVIRPDNTPAGGQTAITRAIVAVSEATGLRFIYDGATTETIEEQREPYQPKRYGDRWAPVLFAWATVDEVPDFGIDVAGEAGGQSVHDRSGQSFYVTGAVYLDANKARQITHRDGPGLVQAIIEHELGHLVGLAHDADKSQLMFPRAQRSVLEYQAGDLTGLARLGQGACAPNV